MNRRETIQVVSIPLKMITHPKKVSTAINRVPTECHLSLKSNNECKVKVRLTTT
jgi:hypothetical protein